VLLEALAISIGLQFSLAILMGFLLPPSPSAYTLTMAAVTILSGVGALAWVRLRPPRGAAFGWSSRGLWRQAAVGAAAAGIAIVPTLLIERAVGSLLGRSSLDNPGVEMAVTILQGAPLVVTVGLICVVVPVLEETLFRGVIFRGLAARSGFWPAAVVSALIFSLLHMSAAAAFPLFLLGLLFAWLCHRYQSLVAPAAAHGVYNALNLAILVFVHGT